ncbi:plasminogen-like [Branchiostoma floridae]|uniref:Plasminogen-like n=1 Tax=Branchiostoma floridae TaxID=7739 RepID=A0A9J7LWX5_BRAFL|nr:plasminogen-like [Branchiostoma floridae]
MANVYTSVAIPHFSSSSNGHTSPVPSTGEPDGSDYRGNVSVTVSGKTCQRWDVEYPHTRLYWPEKFPQLVENYCRNPDGDEGTIWCYTTDPDTRWEYCTLPGQCSFVCMSSTSASDYRGNVSVTISGETCQRWDVDSPHTRIYLPEKYPELVENYCRNPDGEPGQWCYTTDPNKRWEFCCNAACA